MDKNNTDLIIEHITKSKNELLAEINKIRIEFQGLIAIQQNLIHTRLNVSVPPPPKEYGVEKTASSTENNNYKIIISQFGHDRIKITGKTFEYKDIIKESGQARWENDLKGWSLNSSCTETLINKFKGEGLVIGKDMCVNVTSSTVKDEEESVGDTFNNSNHSFVDDN